VAKFLVSSEQNLISEHFLAVGTGEVLGLVLESDVSGELVLLLALVLAQFAVEQQFDLFLSLFLRHGVSTFRFVAIRGVLLKTQGGRKISLAGLALVAQLLELDAVPLVQGDGFVSAQVRFETGETDELPLALPAVVELPANVFVLPQQIRARKNLEN